MLANAVWALSRLRDRRARVDPLALRALVGALADKCARASPRNIAGAVHVFV